MATMVVEGGGDSSGTVEEVTAMVGKASGGERGWGSMVCAAVCQTECRVLSYGLGLVPGRHIPQRGFCVASPCRLWWRDR